VADKKKVHNEDLERPAMQENETPEAYDARIAEAAAAEGLSPTEYKQKLRLESGTV
jgi:hypothetical protein